MFCKELLGPLGPLGSLGPWDLWEREEGVFRSVRPSISAVQWTTVRYWAIHREYTKYRTYNQVFNVFKNHFENKRKQLKKTQFTVWALCLYQGPGHWGTCPLTKVCRGKSISGWSTVEGLKTGQFLNYLTFAFMRRSVIQTFYVLIVSICHISRIQTSGNTDRQADGKQKHSAR